MTNSVQQQKICQLVHAHNGINQSSLIQILKQKQVFNPTTFQHDLEALLQAEVLFLGYDNVYYLCQPRHYKGIVNLKPKGYAFISCEDQEDDYFVNKRNLHGALDHDEVYFHVIPNETANYERDQAIVDGISHRNKTQFVGRICQNDNGYVYFAFSDYRLKKVFTIILNYKQAVLNHTYVASLAGYHIARDRLVIKLLQDLGHHTEPGLDVITKIHEYGIRNSFSSEVKQETKQIAQEVDLAQVSDIKSRIDLTNKYLVTIDGDDSKDFDDAICVERKANGNFVLTVAIADVSYYVQPNSALDQEAYLRGCSVYLVDQVVPMLPAALSNGICSLNPNLLRLCMCSQTEFSANGKVVKHSAFKGYMKSKARLTYNQVNAFLKQEHLFREEELNNMLNHASELAKMLTAQKVAQGFINFSIPEIKLKLSKQGQVLKITNTTQQAAEKLIETFMVHANEQIAEMGLKSKKAFLYRIHTKPEAEKIEYLLLTLDLMHIKHALIDPKKITSLGMQKLLAEVDAYCFKHNIDDTLINMFFLRAMAKAKYDVKNFGHFGLASQCYTHFTSPIRRYPDLLVHRYLKKYYLEEPPFPATPEDLAFLKKACALSVLNEEKAVNCERTVKNMKIVEFMQNYTNQVYSAVISGVLQFGFFVQLENQVEGLVHVKSLANDEYVFEANKQRLKGVHTHQVFYLGQKIKVVLQDVDMVKERLNFSLAT